MTRTKNMPPTKESIIAKWCELSLINDDSATGKFLKAVWAQMIRRGIGVNQLQQMTGIERTSVSRTLNRRGGSPTLATSELYAAAFGMTLEELLASVKKM